MTALYIVFRVAETEYAMPAGQVLQLESFAGVTTVPGTLPHVTGIVQVRGRIVPVIDLRVLFGQTPAEAVLDTRIIVVEQSERTVGLRVDASREVLKLEDEQFHVTPTVVSDRSRGFIRGVARVGPRLLMLLDLAKVIGEEQLHDDSDHILDDLGAGPRALPS